MVRGPRWRRRWWASAFSFPRRWPRARPKDSNHLSERYENPDDPYEDSYDPYETNLLVARARLREQAGDYGGALTILAWLRERSGSASAEELARQAADAGNARALTILGWRREEAGDREAAVQLYRQAAEAGDGIAIGILERWQEETADHTDIQ